jgi:hypothetical protein
MTYQPVPEAERTLIRRWNQEGPGNREISRRRNSSTSSLGREFVRNRAAWLHVNQPAAIGADDPDTGDDGFGAIHNIGTFNTFRLNLKNEVAFHFQGCG